MKCYCVLFRRFAHHFLQLEVIKCSVVSCVIEVTFPLMCLAFKDRMKLFIIVLNSTQINWLQAGLSVASENVIDTAS
jgi:hypothetical protein